MSNPTVKFIHIISTASGENSVEVMVHDSQPLLLSQGVEASFSPPVEISGEARCYMDYIHDSPNLNSPDQWYTISGSNIVIHSQPKVEGQDFAEFSKSFPNPSPDPLNLRVTISPSTGGVMIVGTIDIDTEIIS